MATFVGRVKNSEIIFSVLVSVAGTDEHREYSALLDTGAHMSMITNKVAQEVGLESSGQISVGPISGIPVQCEQYMVRLDIPIGDIENRVLRGKDVHAAEIPFQPDSFDVLLGMDFITEFHITMFGDQFILSN